LEKLKIKMCEEIRFRATISKGNRQCPEAGGCAPRAQLALNPEQVFAPTLLFWGFWGQLYVHKLMVAKPQVEIRGKTHKSNSNIPG
jgi:hypothetical protein